MARGDGSKKMATTKKHSTRKRDARQRVVPVFEGRKRPRFVAVDQRAPPSRTDAAPVYEDTSVDSVEEDTTDDEPAAEPPPFDPDAEDARDLAWYFRLGPKRTPQWLSPTQQRRWWRIHRALDDGGRAICLHYTNSLKTELAFAPAVGEPWLYAWSWWISDPEIALPRTPEECAAFVERVVQRRATAPKRDARSTYIRGRDAAEDKLFDCVRLRVLERLDFEYQTYLERKAKRSESSKCAVFPRAAAVAYFGEQKFRDHYLWGGVVEFSTWGDVRIDIDVARNILDGRLVPGDVPPPPYGQAIAKRLRNAMECALEALQYERAWPEQVGRRDRREALADLAAAATFSPTRNGLPSQESRHVLELVRRELGPYDRRTKRYENDDLEVDPLRHTTNVTEVAAKADLPNTIVRSLLLELKCPGADTKGATLQTSWFSSTPGVEFWRRAAALRDDLYLQQRRSVGSRKRRP